MVTIETDRIVLREFTQEDFGALHEGASNINVVRYMTWGPNTEDDSRRFIQYALQTQIVRPRVVYQFAITLDEKVIGGCDFNINSTEHAEGEIGYLLNEPYWGNGYATEVARALIKYGFEEHGMHRIIAKCDARNEASSHVMEKCGMKREAYLREHRKTRDGRRDTLIYSILRREWSPI